MTAAATAAHHRVALQGRRLGHNGDDMTLRLRLTLAIVALTSVGLIVFSVVLTSFYAASQYDRLDERLSTTGPEAINLLAAEIGLEAPTPGRLGTGRHRVLGPGLDVSVELRDRNGEVLGSAVLLGTENPPEFPATVNPERGTNLFFNVRSDTGERWRVFATRMAFDRVGLVAVPLSEVTAAIRRLVVLEALAGIGLVTALGIGSWLILRRGLRPLENIASTASSITAGDLRHGSITARVAPANTQSEVGQLGLAIDTMLDEIDVALRERDATEHKLRQFLADASHELRTPLTSIQGFAELFRLGAADDPEQLAVVLGRIESESQRMSTLVEELLLLARLDQMRPIERRPVDLTVLGADACTDARATDPDRAVTLDASTSVVVAGDAMHLRQAIANLVTNALRHTPDSTPIEVAVTSDGATATLSVRDHGAGLDPEALERVFDRFWQADSARVGTGTGLGLAIVHAIAAEHGGGVEARNHPDGGAEFLIRITVAPAGDPVPAPAPAPASNANPSEST